jgi:hypothetical protein
MHSQFVPRSKHATCWLYKKNQSILYREIIAVCSENRTKHINTPCGQDAEFLLSFIKSRNSAISVIMALCPLVRLSAGNNSATTEGIFRNFFLFFSGNLQRKFKLNSKYDEKNWYVTRRRHTFKTTSR